MIVGVGGHVLADDSPASRSTISYPESDSNSLVVEEYMNNRQHHLTIDSGATISVLNKNIFKKKEKSHQTISPHPHLRDCYKNSNQS